MTPWDFLTAADVPAGVTTRALLVSDQGPLTSEAAMGELAPIGPGALAFTSPVNLDPAGGCATRAATATFQPSAGGVTVQLQGFAVFDPGGLLLATAWLSGPAPLSPYTGPVSVSGVFVVARTP